AAILAATNVNCRLTYVFVMELLTIIQTSFGLFRIAVVVIPFLYVGTLISKNFAALLEEHDIFVPEDDDDDD
uniref:Essential MCU regulator, mitochondrial n=1 Tax=Oncorhynchus mykiss TaxID=8022 RepID=A0A8C7PWZ9_ONCMY